MVVPDTTDFSRSRAEVKIQKRQTVVVSDPTQDLPLSIAEADSLKQNLYELKFEVRHFYRQYSVKSNIIKSIEESSIFHFCGHGKSNPFNTTNCQKN